MADPQGQQQDDQSMEEILQSIRRIIAEENDDPAAQDQPREGEDVLELTEIIGDDQPEATQLQPSGPEPVKAPVSEKPASDGDILSSIDAILQDDAPAAAPAPSAPEPEKAEPAMSEATQPEEKENQPVVAESSSDAPAQKAIDDDGELLSSDAAAKAAAALSELRNAPQPERQAAPRHSASLRSGATVEDLVVESLRPMLKEWLDANLPELVRELVEREIRKLRA